MKKVWVASLLMTTCLTMATGMVETPIQADSTSTTENDSVLHKTVTVYPDLGPIYLYDATGQAIKNVAIAANSNLATAGTVTINGEKFYQVATDSYVKASDVYSYKLTLVRIKITQSPAATLRDAHGQVVANRAVANGTSWSVDKVIQLNGKNYYRISDNEFVSSSNAILIK